MPFDEARKHFERDYLVRLLKITGGNVTQAALLAKRNRTEFYKLLQRHRLEPAMFKEAQGALTWRRGVPAYRRRRLAAAAWKAWSRPATRQIPGCRRVRSRSVGLSGEGDSIF